MAIKASAQITMIDLTDITVSNTAPLQPTTNQMWLDTSTNPSILKRYNGKTWDRVSDFTDDINDAIDNIQIGGRNLIIRNGELVNKMVDMNGSVGSFTGSNLMLDFIPVVPGENLMFSQTSVAGGDNYFRYAFYTDDKTIVIRRAANNKINFMEIVPSGASWLRVSYDSNNIVKIERGNKVTDWTPAPEDLTEKIEANTMDVKFALDEISTLVKNTTITKDGKDITLKDAYSSTSQTVGELKDSVTSLETKRNITSFRYIRDWLNGSSSNTGNHWVELQVWANNTNIAKGLVPTSDVALTNPNYLTDELINNSFVTCATGWHYVQLDLGSVRTDIDMVKTWHYTDGRQYNTRFEVSVDGVSWIRLFDSDIGGRYKETANGRTYIFNNGSIETRLKSAENKITDDSIVNIVRNSTTYKSDLNSKVGQDAVDNSINGIEVGGRNLWRSGDFSSVDGIRIATATVVDIAGDNPTGHKKALYVNKNGRVTFDWFSDYSPEAYGGTYTFSCWIKYKDVVQGVNSYNKLNVFKNSLYYKTNEGVISTVDYPQATSFTGTSEWRKVVWTYTYNRANYSHVKTSIFVGLEGVGSGEMWVTGIKLEKGNKATDWTPAREDIDSQINDVYDYISNTSSEQTLQQQAYIELVRDSITSTVEETYSTKSDTEESIRTLSTQLEETSKDINMKFKDERTYMEEVEGQLQSFKDTVETNINFDAEGITIGKSGSEFSSKFTNDKLSFNQGGNEVAYIGSNKMYITDAEINNKLTLGNITNGFFDFVPRQNGNLSIVWRDK